MPISKVTDGEKRKKKSSISAFAGTVKNGGVEITVSAIEKVISYGRDRLELETKNRRILFRGSAISISVLDRKILELKGDIKEISLENENNT